MCAGFRKRLPPQPVSPGACPPPGLRCAHLLQTRKSPLWKWNQRLVDKLPWLHMDIKKLATNPMLSVLSDRSAIFEGEPGRGRICWGRQKSGAEGEAWVC